MEEKTYDKGNKNQQKILYVHRMLKRNIFSAFFQLIQRATHAFPYDFLERNKFQLNKDNSIIFYKRKCAKKEDEEDDEK